MDRQTSAHHHHPLLDRTYHVVRVDMNKSLFRSIDRDRRMQHLSTSSSSSIEKKTILCFFGEDNFRTTFIGKNKQTHKQNKQNQHLFFIHHQKLTSWLALSDSLLSLPSYRKIKASAGVLELPPPNLKARKGGGGGMSCTSRRPAPSFVSSSV